MSNLLVIGKRGGILHWFEDVMNAVPQGTPGYSLTHNSLRARFSGWIFGKNTAITRRIVHAELAGSLQHYKPSIVLIVDLFYLENEVNRLLIESGATVFQWIGDRFEDRLVNNTSVQHFFFTDTGLVDMARVRGLPASYIPLGAAEPKHNLHAWKSRESSILFIGAPSDNRIDFLERMEHPVTVIGPKWPNLSNPKVLLNRRRIPITQTRELYEKHKFVLNIPNAGNVIHGIPARCFDASVNGACILTQYSDDIYRNFSETDIITFNDAYELNSLLSNLDDSQVEKIALAGRNRAKSSNMMQHRINDIITSIHATSSRP